MYGYGAMHPFFVFPTPPSRKAEPPEVERLARAFADHGARERDSLDEYRQAAERTGDPLLRFLLNLVVADEERHHALVEQIAESLRANLAWSTPASPLPTLGRLSAEERDSLLRLTSAFIEEEERGLSECRALIKTSETYYNGLLSLLLRTMIHDSEKHLMILRFIKRQLRDARPWPEATADLGQVPS